LSRFCPEANGDNGANKPICGYTVFMRAEIKRGRESSIYYEGRFYDTGVPLELSFSDAFRLSRVCNMENQYDNVPYDERLWADQKFYNFIGDVEQLSGFGGVSFNLIKYSSAEHKIALGGRTLGVRDQDILTARNREMRQDSAGIWHDQPREQWLYSPFRRNIAITPFETTVIPRSWIGKINQFDALFVPCVQNIEAFRASGVKIPIELIHWGVEPTVFAPVVRPERDFFVFGTMGALTERKGTDVLLAAFQEAFPRSVKDVRLICKTSNEFWQFPVNDDRVRIMQGKYSHKELMDEFFKEIDCFVFPTRGEGFGLTPLEAMATGVPSIVTGWSGPMEYMTPEVGWTLDYKMAPAQVFTDIVYKEDCGDWAEPSKDDLVAKMRYAYEHRAETKEKGAAAAKYVQENWTWQKKISLYHDALAKHL